MTERVELLIEDLDGQGYGVGFADGDGRPIRVWGTTIGDRIRVRIIHRSQHRMVGELETLLEQTLAPNQWEKQVQVKRNSQERVDFGVRRG